LGDGLDYFAIGSDIKFKLCNGKEMLLNGMGHMLGLMRNMIPLAFSHEDGWLYQMTTLRVVMHGGKDSHSWWEVRCTPIKYEGCCC
jgi:hypothetical protein